MPNERYGEINPVILYPLIVTLVTSTVRPVVTVLRMRLTLIGSRAEVTSEGIVAPHNCVIRRKDV